MIAIACAPTRIYNTAGKRVKKDGRGINSTT